MSRRRQKGICGGIMSGCGRGRNNEEQEYEEDDGEAQEYEEIRTRSTPGGAAHRSQPGMPGSFTAQQHGNQHGHQHGHQHGNQHGAYGASTPMNNGMERSFAYGGAGAPMAAMNVGGAVAVGADRNRDGIPDLMQYPSYASAPMTAVNMQGPSYASSAPMTAVNMQRTAVNIQNPSYGSAQEAYAMQRQGQTSTPMAAMNVGGAVAVGADRNRDGIPDFMQTQMQTPYGNYGGAAAFSQGYGGYGGYGGGGGSYGSYGGMGNMYAQQMAMQSPSYGSYGGAMAMQSPSYASYGGGGYGAAYPGYGGNGMAAQSMAQQSYGMSMYGASPSMYGAAQCAPMAAASYGGGMVIGEDRNRDGIPDALQQQQQYGGMYGGMFGNAAAMPTMTSMASPGYPGMAPMAAANFGGNVGVGQDRNMDGIPDVLQGQQYANGMYGGGGAATPPAYGGGFPMYF